MKEEITMNFCCCCFSLWPGLTLNPVLCMGKLSPQKCCQPCAKTCLRWRHSEGHVTIFSFAGSLVKTIRHFSGNLVNACPCCVHMLACSYNFYFLVRFAVLKTTYNIPVSEHNVQSFLLTYPSQPGACVNSENSPCVTNVCFYFDRHFNDWWLIQLCDSERYVKGACSSMRDYHWWPWKAYENK